MAAVVILYPLKAKSFLLIEVSFLRCNNKFGKTVHNFVYLRSTNKIVNLERRSTIWPNIYRSNWDFICRQLKKNFLQCVGFKLDVHILTSWTESILTFCLISREIIFLRTEIPWPSFTNKIPPSLYLQNQHLFTMVLFL